MIDQIPAHDSAVIKQAWSAFTQATGLKPNILIVGPNGADAIAADTVIWGMKIMVNDFADKDYTVGYVL